MQNQSSQAETSRRDGPDSEMTQRTYQQEIPKLYAYLNDISSNLHYIRQELPKQNTTEAIRTTLLKACDDFLWELQDIRQEVRTLEDNLGMHPGEEPFDHSMGSSDPKVTMSYIKDWLGAQLKIMHALATDLFNAAQDDPDSGCLFLLVAESATNILNAANTLSDNLSMIAATLDQSPAQRPSLTVP